MKKRKRNSLKSSSSKQPIMVSSIQTRSKTMAAAKTTAETTTATYLPDECWERIFKLILNNDGERYLEPLSLVSKQFLSITNCFKFSLTINYDLPEPYLRRLFQRFINLTSLDFTNFRDDLNELLSQISNFSIHNFNLKSLKINKIPSNGLRDFSKKIKTLTSLTISKTQLCINDLVVISDCFPFLEQLDLFRTVAFDIHNIDVELKAMSKALPKLRKINLPRYIGDIDDSLILNLCKNCEFLEEVNMLHCSSLTQDSIASAVRERPGLTSLSFMMSPIDDISFIHIIDSLVSLKGLTCLDLTNSHISDQFLYSIAKEGLALRKLVLQDCIGYSYAGIFDLLSKIRCIQHLNLRTADFLSDHLVSELSLFLLDLVSINLGHCKMLTDSALFALARNCPSISEIEMENTSIGEKTLEDSNSMMNNIVNPRLKSLLLASNSCMKDENIIVFASIFPNLQFLDLSYCKDISEGIGDVLKRCCKIIHLKLVWCLGLNLHRMNFEVSKLEVLNLSASKIYDSSLYAISKSCFGLLQLDLGYCDKVTEKGVREVVNKCTKLREINMLQCHKVNASVVEYIVIKRPTLRKITAPPSFCFSDSKRKFYLRHGCFVC